MEKEEFQAKIYSKIDELPTLPAVLPKLLSLIENEKSSAAHVAEVISHDSAMTAKIIKVANSAYYGFSQEISSLEKAVPLLGFNMVRSLALSIGVIESLPSGEDSTLFSREGLWVHSLAVATAMQELRKRFEKEDSNEHHFVVGLLHDIGKLVLDQFFTTLFQQALEEAHSHEKIELYVAERSIIGFDHGEIGGMVLTRWKFPDLISTSIAVHHQTDFPEGKIAKDIAMLRIADALPQGIGLGRSGNPIPPEIHENDLKILGISEEELADMREYLDSAKSGIHALLSAMT
ncbi:MAG: HDOD domain-containing protein [Deltaproteobacteria bacterium]|nr:HDOD domain-containing protein [Deltaproteobacteria bacterium]